MCPKYLNDLSIRLDLNDLNFREEYVDGAEYLLKHEEDTHVEGQVCKQCFMDTFMLKDKYADNTLRIHPDEHTHVEGQVCTQCFTDTAR